MEAGLPDGPHSGLNHNFPYLLAQHHGHDGRL